MLLEGFYSIYFNLYNILILFNIKILLILSFLVLKL